MLSRVADAAFWMGRYIERAENVARFIDVNLNLTLDMGRGVAEQWAPLVYTTGDQEEFAKRHGQVNRDTVLKFLTFDQDNHNSILRCLYYARENARTVRGVISAAMWEELNKFYLLVRDAASAGTPADPYEFYHQIIRCSQLLGGLTESTMSRGESYHFVQLGRLLERADKTSRILDVKYFLLLPKASDVGSPVDVVQWQALLKSASALEMYRQVHGRIAPGRVVQFLVQGREFPRSMLFCVESAQESLRTVLGVVDGAHAAPVINSVTELLTKLEDTGIEQIIGLGLHQFIDQAQSQLNQLGEHITAAFFRGGPEVVMDHEPSPAGESSPSQNQSQG